MPVLGQNARVIDMTGETVDVKPFSSACNTLQDVPIVDAVIKYNDKVSGKSHLLLIKNALYVPSNVNNLIPPFMMREAGVIVNDTPRIHVDDPTNEDHTLYFPEEKVRIPLYLSGIFSYFETSLPTEEECEECEEALLLTPIFQWDPHNPAYAQNEQNIVDWKGNVLEKGDRVKIHLSDIPDDPTSEDAFVISSAKIAHVSNYYPSVTQHDFLRRACG